MTDSAMRDDRQSPVLYLRLRACNTAHMTALGKLLPFDRPFGSYVAERGGLPCRYGWTKALASYYLLAIVATERRWIDREAAQSRDAAKVMEPPVMPPDWPCTNRLRAAGEDSWLRRHAATHAD